MAQKNEGLMYKNHPLRRIGNMLYYGSMADPYIIFMQVKESRKEKDLDLATKVSVVKRSEKDSLYSAMDISAIWLERALAGK